MLDAERYISAEKKALELLIDYEYIEFPLDVFEFAKKVFGAEIIKYSSLPKEKLIELNKFKELDDSFTVFEHISDGTIHYKVYYNDDKPYYRQRYSIGHEIKHIVYGEENPTDEEELLAEYFSKVLLAPKCMVILAEVCSPAEITEKFGIGPQPASYHFTTIQKRMEKYGKEMFEYESEFLKLRDEIIEIKKKD